MLPLFLACLLVMLASVSGVVVLWKSAGQFIEKNLKYLVSLSAGVFLVVAFRIFSNATATAEHFARPLVWVAIGVIGIFILFRLFSSFHHHHDTREETHGHSTLEVKRILSADGIHNIADGILLASSFIVSPSLGFAAALSIFFHEIVQETSEFFVMRQAGYSTRRALGMNVAVSSTILIGAFGTYFLLGAFEALEIPLLGLATGAFVLVVFFDLIPHSVRSSSRPTHYFLHALWFLVGVGLMFTVLQVTSSHEHNHGHEHAQYQSPASFLA